MSRKGVTFLVIGFCFLQQIFSQKSDLWENFKQAKIQGEEPILPDFSYAGYKHGEIGIPEVSYPIYNVLDFGAVPNDNNSDKAAVKEAIAAAVKNGRGVVYFPPGQYHLNTGNDELTPIFIEHSNVVFRGSKKKPSILFFDKELPSATPEKMWTTPFAIQTKANTAKEEVFKVVGNSRRESFTIEVSDATQIKVGNWYKLCVLNNSKELVEYDLGGLVSEPEWTSILNNGVKVNEIHQVEAINGNIITFKEPIHFDVNPEYGWELKSYHHLEGVGFENLTFLGHWEKEFVHHRSIQDDGGWSILKLSDAVNSWIKDCVFKNVNRAVSIHNSAAVTAINITIEGAIGHTSIDSGGGSTGVLLANIHDKAGMHHSTGVAGGSTTGTVVWRSRHPSHTCFESHASQPRCTLFDRVSGGFFKGRGGGARQNLPNHGKYLVLWNYRETDEPEEDFRFVAQDSWYWRIVPPIIVGFHGSGTTFKEDEVMYQESVGKPVRPESLYEAQLMFRLGKLPLWINEVKSIIKQM